MAYCTALDQSKLSNFVECTVIIIIIIIIIMIIIITTIIIMMEFIHRLYIVALSALQCKKEHKNIINQNGLAQSRQ